MPKCEEGLGIRKTEDVNTAFLTKQGWKILTQPVNIWVRLVKAKYFNKGNNSFLTCNKSSLTSKLGRIFCTK